MSTGSLIRRLGAFLNRSQHDDDLRDEVEEHIERRTQSLIDEGMDPREAAYEARRSFGNVTAIREETRDMWTFRWIDTLVQDLRFGARLLRRSPMFTFAAVASLAIGIGSSAAVFSLADGLLFRVLPVATPEDLVLFRWSAHKEWPFNSLNGMSSETETDSSSTSFALKTFSSLRESLAQQAEVFAFADLYRVNVAVDGHPDSASGQVVSGNYFGVLGIAPAAGRLLTADDDRPGAPAAAVIGFDLWRRRFGGAADAVGRQIVINGVSFTVAGVLPRGFTGTLQVGQSCDVMVPMASYGAVVRSEDDPADANYWWVLMMARLKPAGTADRVQTAADAVLKQNVLAAKPDFPVASLPRMLVEPGSRGQSEARNSMREPLQIMALVVAVVLLVACANVASLLLVRGRARAREMAVRTAIGAPRRRIVRQLLTEGLLLGGLASMVGLVFTQWISSVLLPAIAADYQDLAIEYAPDLRIVGFTCLLAIVCSILFALLPAVRTSDGGLPPLLQESSRGTVSGRRRFGGGGVLVVTQVALSMLLLSAAGLLAWSAYGLQRVNPGFDPQNLLTFSVDTSLNGYDRVRSRAFVASTLDELRALPGVTDASVTSHRLIANSSSIGIARPAGAPAVPPDSDEARAFAAKNRAWRLSVDDRFFQTFKVPLLRGRTFGAIVDPDGPPLAIVNAKLAQQLFGTVEVIGRRVQMGLRPEGPEIEIIGVAPDTHYTSLKRDPPPTIYFPFQQGEFNRMTFAVRTAGDPMGLAGTVRETLRGLDGTLPIFSVRSQQEQILLSLAQERLFASLALLLGIVTLVLSGIGLYGLLAYAVARRTPEIGVRIALGAGLGQVRWMILRQSLVLVSIGLVLGIPAARWSTGLLESMLFGLSPTDPRAIACAAAVMIAVGIAAAYVPARRAARIDPIVALRAE